jgi:hypothetical protein
MHVPANKFVEKVLEGPLQLHQILVNTKQERWPSLVISSF